MKIGEYMDELNRRSRAAGSHGRTTARGASASGRPAAEGSRTRSSGSAGSRTRASGSAGRGSGGSSRSGARSGRSSAVYNNYDRRPPVSHGRGGRHRRSPGPNYFWIAVVGVVLIVAIGIGVFALKGRTDSETEPVIETTPPETELQKEVKVGNVTITGLSREAAREKILEEYPWDMAVTWNGETIEIPNLMETKVDQLLQEIYQGEPKESYVLDTSGLEERIATEVSAVAAKWDKPAKNASISSFDKESGKFVFTGEESGQAVDQEALTSAIMAALSLKDFDVKIPAQVTSVTPEITEATAREKYKTISEYTTKTTNNSKRNTNVRLACEAIDGIVLAPGESFSFNERVGERTTARGYQSAAAYSNGEVVQETGGGVCQVSTTLYNAVVRGGLKTTVRRSHTFEPSYVTPGMDATVSWGGPDYVFENNSSTGIGIRASYKDLTCTVSIYAIPILEEGIKYDLKSTKTKNVDPPAPTYVEDQSIQPGQEVVESKGSTGSQWEVRLVVTKNGEKVSDDVDHTSSYKGHAPVVKRNTSGVWVPLPGQTNADGTPVLPVETNPDGTPVLPGTGAPSESSGTTSAPEASIPAGPGDEGQISGPGSDLPGPGSTGSIEPAGPGTDTGSILPPGPGTSNNDSIPAGPGSQGPAGPGV